MSMTSTPRFFWFWLTTTCALAIELSTTSCTSNGHVLDAADRVLNPRADAVNDVIIRFEFIAQHPDGRENAILAVHVIMLDDGVHKRVLRRDVYLARVALHFFEVVLVDFLASLGQFDNAAVIEAGDVAARDRYVGAADAYVAFSFGVGDGVTHALVHAFQMDDLALAHPRATAIARRRALLTSHPRGLPPPPRTPSTCRFQGRQRYCLCSWVHQHRGQTVRQTAAMQKTRSTALPSGVTRVAGCRNGCGA